MLTHFSRLPKLRPRMTRKGQKLQEMWILERFLQSMGETAPGAASDFLQSEEPDWVLTRDGGSSLGIEITTIYHHHPQYSGLTLRQEEGIQTHICRLVEHTWHNSGLPHAEISIHFTGDQFPSKTDEKPIGDAIVALIKVALPRSDDTYTEIDSDLLWDHPVLGGLVHRIHIYRSSVLGRPYVHAPGASFLPPLNDDAVRTVITSKSAKLPNYKTRCREVWLVIVHNNTSLATHFDRRPSIAVEDLDLQFDRVYLFDDLKSEIQEVGHTHALHSPSHHAEHEC